MPKDVSGGITYANKTWKHFFGASAYPVKALLGKTVSLPNGTYRAVVTYTVYGTYGTGGEPDVITGYAEASY